MYGSLDISVSGMVAQRTRMDVIASNLANAGALIDPNGDSNPYRRRIAVFETGTLDGPGQSGHGLGVHVSDILEDQSDFKPFWDPGHPLAVKETDEEQGLQQGYVYYPNVDPVIEQINAVEASRAYEANIAAAEATKTMMAEVLRLLA